MSARTSFSPSSWEHRASPLPEESSWSGGSQSLHLHHLLLFLNAVEDLGESLIGGTEWVWTRCRAPFQVYNVKLWVFMKMKAEICLYQWKVFVFINWAAVINYHGLGGLYTTAVDFSGFWRLRSLGSRHWQILCLVLTHFLACRWLSSRWVLAWQRERKQTLLCLFL